MSWRGFGVSFTNEGHRLAASVTFHTPVDPDRVEAARQAGLGELQQRLADALEENPDVAKYRAAQSQFLAADAALDAALELVKDLEAEREKLLEKMPADAGVQVRALKTKANAAHNDVSDQTAVRDGFRRHAGHHKPAAVAAAAKIAKSVFTTVSQEFATAETTALAGLGDVASQHLDTLAKVAGRREAVLRQDQGGPTAFDAAKALAAKLIEPPVEPQAA